MSLYDARLLRRLIGTRVTTYDDFSDIAPNDSSARRISRSPSTAPTTHTAYTELSAVIEDSWTWVIKQKLSERAVHQTETDVKLGGGTPMTVGMFLCHLEGHPDREALMRIYYQIPIDGTEDADIDTLAQQAVPPEVCGELESFKLLKGCPAVPRFLGHAERTQGEHDLVPGGYIQYIVWEKVPGKPLTGEFFWSLDRQTRDEIRSKFRIAYE